MRRAEYTPLTMPNDIYNKLTRAPDPRPARTRAAILDAIDRLGMRNAEVSVASIVAEAYLSRSSFYSQFKDLGDVVVQLISEVADEMEAHDHRLRGSGRTDEANLGAVHMLVAEMHRRRGLYAAVLGSSASSETPRQVIDIISSRFEHVVRVVAPPGADTRIWSVYMVAGALAVLIDWVRSSNPVTPERMTADIIEMMPDWIK